jgi:Zn finger protein HypA/HybF involved in hydrogenase expression
MSLALEIRSICDRELARQNGGGRLIGIGLEVGALAGVDAQNLEFCLGAVLAERYGPIRCEVRTLPGSAACLSCREVFPVRRAPFECPKCGGAARGVEGGDELRVDYLELE